MSNDLRPDLPDRLRAVAVLRQEARRRGFDRIGFARAEQPSGFAGFLSWLEQGRHAGMDYLARTAPVRAQPARYPAGHS